MSVRARLFALCALALLLSGARAVPPPAATRPASFGRGPAIVLVRGPGCDAGQWLPTARVLARRHRVVFADLPGCGEGALSGRLTLDLATRALDAQLARAAQEPVVLVGHSLGGLVAAAEACSRPSRVRALVLVETALRPQAPWPHRRAALERGDPVALRTVCASSGGDSALADAFRREAAAQDPALQRAWLRLGLTTDLSARVARLRCPLLVVLAPGSWPRGEPWVEAAAALGYGAVPRVRAARVDSCGHFVMLDRPDELARLIERFAGAPDGGPVVLLAETVTRSAG